MPKQDFPSELVQAMSNAGGDIDQVAARAAFVRECRGGGFADDIPQPAENFADAATIPAAGKSPRR